MPLGQNPLQDQRGGKEILLFVDAAKLAASAHRTNTCASCHVDLTDQHPDDNLAAKPVDCRHCHERQSASYGASVHGRAVTLATPARPPARIAMIRTKSCRPFPQASPLHVTKQATTCGACHDRSGGGLRGEHPRQSIGRRRTRCAHLHGLPFGTQDRIAGQRFGAKNFRGRLQPLPRVRAVEHEIQSARRPGAHVLRQLPRPGQSPTVRRWPRIAQAAMAITKFCPRPIPTRRSTPTSSSRPAASVIRARTKSFP
jgi:hypothetical protein